MASRETGPLLRKVDCVQIPVPDLDAGLRFYPFGNPLVLLDLSRGTFVTDDDGNVTGVTS
jgi:hypothetical protein